MSLIDDFVKATASAACPENFRRWAGYAVVSTMMSRRVWTETITGVPLYGNIFAVFVGGPGSGKTFAIEYAKQVVRPFTNNVSVSPNDVTYAAMCQQLGDVFMDPELQQVKYGRADDMSYMICAEEVASLLPEPDLRMMQTMASMWSCLSDDWSKGTKGNGSDNVFAPYVTMLAGAQPAWFQQVLGASGLELGLPSRIMFIYYPDELEIEYFSTKHNIRDQLDAFRPKVEPILKCRGMFRFSQEAKDRFVSWNNDGRPDQQGQLRLWTGVLADYKRRRAQHLAKLALVNAVARHPTHYIIEADDLDVAFTDLWAVEDDLPAVMDLVSGNPFRSRERAVLAFVDSFCNRADPPLMIPEAIVRKKLAEQIPTHMVDVVLRELLATKQLRVAEEHAGTPNRKFLPGRLA